MARISKKQQMFNTLMANVICAESDYRDGKMSLETLLAVYKENRMFAMRYFDDLYANEWYESAAVTKIDVIYKEMIGKIYNKMVESA